MSNVRAAAILGARVTLSLVLTISVTAGCGGEAPLPALDQLRLGFPEQAERVLTGAGHFAPSAQGFIAVRAGDEGQGSAGWAALSAELPGEGEDAVVLGTAGGGEVRVREIGAAGRGEPIEGAIAYRRAAGTSFWTVAAGGVEEWLQIEAGGLRDDGLAASWAIEGASLRQAGEAVDVVDGEGFVRIHVSAPSAYAAGGRAIGARLRVEGSTLSLYVDPTRDEVLIDPLWTSAAPMAAGRLSHASVKLADGRVLVSGGFNANGYTASAEIYNPATNTWSPTGSMLVARGRHTLSLLPNGKVLMVGAYIGINSPPTDVEIYDPATGVWSNNGSLSARFDHTATTLNDGRILIAGGNTNLAVLNTALVYDPATNTFAATPNMPHLHQAHRATKLSDGRVLLTGDFSGNNVFNDMIAADIYNPATNTWAAAGGMKAARYNHAAGLLPDGRVIVAGGQGTNNAYLSSAEIYNPATNTFALVASMNASRGGPSGAMLSDGTFLMAGGYSGLATLATSQRYDAATNTWSNAGNMPSPHYGAATVVLDNSDVLVATGSGAAGVSYSTAVEIFTLRNQVGSPCASNNDCQTGFCADGFCCNAACDAGPCDTCSAAGGSPTNGLCTLLTGPVCNDGNACTTGDTCHAGVCSGTSSDGDGDGVPDSCDNCPATPNPHQSDANGNGAGNACDPQCSMIRRGGSGAVADAQVSHKAGVPLGLDAEAGQSFGALSTADVGYPNAKLSRKMLLRFDLGGVPPVASITAATVTLSVSSASTGSFNVRRALAPWDEGTVTWTSFNNAQDAAPQAPPIFDGGAGYQGPVSFNIPALVQSWVSGAFPNNGVVLVGEPSFLTTVSTSEAAAPESRPRLDLCYLLPD